MSRSRHPVRLFTKPPAPEVADKYLLTWEPAEIVRNPDSFPPLSAGGLFGCPEKLLELDIGCSTGEFCLQLAKSRPDCLVVGVDRAGKPLFRAVEEAHKTGLSNVKFLKTDFRTLIPHLVPSSIGGAYYHFPHPYSKARHLRTGVFCTEFLNAMKRALHPQGFLSVMTDHQGTFEHFLQVAREFSGLATNTNGPFRGDFVHEMKSFHHAKWEMQGRTVFRMELYVEGSDSREAVLAERLLK